LAARCWHEDGNTTGRASYLAPLAGRGRVARKRNPGEGRPPRIVLAEKAPHPNPLPASGARERTTDGVGSKPNFNMSKTAMNQPASAYFMEERHEPTEAHTLSVLVQNEPGVLARVIGLFSGRGYNIESLTVSETENQKHLSRITIVTTGTPMVIEQIKHQLDRMVPVYRVVDMTLSGRSIERELAMVKLRGTGEHRVEALRLAEAFRARVIDATTESFVFEITGNSAKINQFIDLMRPLGLVEVSRTGVAAIGRGPEGM